MKIVLEGCDGTGKTTLAIKLSNIYRLDVCHCTQYDPSDFLFYQQTLRKENIVWDRHTIGELIYPRVFNREQKVTEEEVMEIIEYGKKIGARFFVLTADNALIKKRLETRGGENKLILDNIDFINSEFVSYAHKFNIPVIDTSKMTFSQIINLIN